MARSSLREFQERLARRRSWIAAVCDLGACFDLPDIRHPHP